MRPNPDPNPFGFPESEDPMQAPGTSGRGPYAKSVEHPCTQCGGTGQWLGGRTNRAGSSKCFACGGRGHFMTSQHDRDRAKASRQRSKADEVRRVNEHRAQWVREHEAVCQFIRRGCDRGDGFMLSMEEAIGRWGALTPNQLAAVERQMARAAERRQERAAGGQTVDLSSVRAMFEAAKAAALKLPGAIGRKPPVYRAEGLKISMAPDRGRNPGALYVVRIADDEYLGKIVGTTYTGREAPGLAIIAADPRAAAVRHGQEYGQCSCCGATLTNADSIAAGIGPICATKWGI